MVSSPSLLGLFGQMTACDESSYKALVQPFPLCQNVISCGEFTQLSLQIVTLISARMAAAILLFEIVLIAVAWCRPEWRAQIQRRVYLIISVTFFQAFLFLQIPREASVFALQLLKVPLLAAAFQMTILTAHKRGDITV